LKTTASEAGNNKLLEIHVYHSIFMFMLVFMLLKLLIELNYVFLTFGVTFACVNQAFSFAPPSF